MGLAFDAQPITRGAAAGLLVVLAACAQQPGSTAATRSSAATQGSVLTASTPGWRATQQLPNLAVGGLWAGGARDAWLAGDECADPATCGESAMRRGWHLGDSALLAELGCSTLRGPCGVPHAHYPKPTKIDYAPLPGLPGLSDPCAGIPANAFCRAAAASSRS